MRAVRNIEGNVRVVEVPEPDGPGVRVNVRAASICGSDLEMIRTGLANNTLGHEFAGVTDNGVAVAVQPYVPCGECEGCAAGQPQMCSKLAPTMLGVFADGGMSDAVVVDPSCLSPLPAGVRVEDASLVEPLGVSLHACNRAGIAPGMRVGVVGGGPIGLLSAAVAKHLGADVTLQARHPRQFEAAEQLGVATGQARGCDVVIEAAGTTSGFDDAVRAARRMATIVLVSTTWEPIPVSFLVAQMRENTIIPAFTYGHAHGEREFDTAARILSEHPEIAPALVSHRFGLDEATHAFAVATDRAAGAVKVVLHP